jgi:hypothetical protein
VATLRAARLHLVNARPGDAGVMRRAGFMQIIFPVTVAILPLDPDPGAQLTRALGKWRNAARQGSAASL